MKRWLLLIPFLDLAGVRNVTDPNLHSGSYSSCGAIGRICAFCGPLLSNEESGHPIASLGTLFLSLFFPLRVASDRAHTFILGVLRHGGPWVDVSGGHRTTVYPCGGVDAPNETDAIHLPSVGMLRELDLYPSDSRHRSRVRNCGKSVSTGPSQVN
ncbi:MAG TPA: hypothetical protein VMF06_11330 [Candidatus Limnocylindria bacterium]|jgi:hypothetical protein|nr:hypothetical protein [Candidatus Limnocylindria bacterium]